jgi:PAS domain S-box-containing protein
MRDNQKKESRVMKHHDNGKQAEARLREYERIVEGLEEMIAVVDRDYRYLIANRAFLNQWGLKREKVVGHLISEVLDKDVFERVVKPKLEECFQGKVVRYEMDYSYPEIGERVLFVSYLPIEGPNGIDRVACVLRDITERQRAENALREAEHKYREIFENVGEGIFQSTPDGRFISANPALARMHGFDSPEDLIRSRDDISRQIYADSARREEFKRLLEENGIVRGFEHQASRKDGSKIWISVNARSVRDERGTILYYEGTAQDINERKRAEGRSAAFAKLARKLSGARTQLDAGRIIAQTAGDLFGWDSCDLNLYDADRDLVHQMLNIDMIDGQQTEVTGVVSDRKPTARSRRVIDHGAELRLREEPVQFDADAIPFGDKTRPSASMMTVPIRHAARVIGLLSIQSYTAHSYDTAALNDLEALADHCGEALNRIRAEEELRESEERYRELFENAKDAIYVHDLKGRYTSLNRAAEKLSGYSREEILGRHFSNFVAPSSLKDVRANLCKKLDEVGETVYEIDLITRDRRRVPVEVVSRLIYESGVSIGVQGTARDITDSKRAQEALRTYSRRLMEVLEAERQTIARELHDEIGQVLTAVKINLQSVQHSCRTADCVPRLDESIGIVDEALGRVRELSIELRPSLLDDLGLTAALRWYVDRYAQRTGIIAEVLNSFKEDDRLPRELETACFRIAQEALTNVIRHARAGSVSVQLERSGGSMLLTVMDDGVGFDIDNLRKSASAASALGLLGMEERALAVGGYIEIDSGSGRGTRVRATFPLKRK